MTRRPSPIEMAIDRATGFKPTARPAPAPRRIVTLRCPCCQQSKGVVRLPHDPPGTAVVEYPCPKCLTQGEAEVVYFDAAGRQLNVDGEVITPAPEAP
jgi:hypothetical protein